MHECKIVSFIDNFMTKYLLNVNLFTHTIPGRARCLPIPSPSCSHSCLYRDRHSNGARTSLERGAASLLSAALCCPSVTSDHGRACLAGCVAVLSLGKNEPALLGSSVVGHDWALSDYRPPLLTGVAPGQGPGRAPSKRRAYIVSHNSQLMPRLHKLRQSDFAIVA